MWISIKDRWASSHSDLSKYFIEKIKQQVDSSEVISNKHRTSNGLTLIAELITVSNLTKKRSKYKNRLISLLNESKSPYLNTNIINDYILTRYFKDIVAYYKKLDPKKIAGSEREISSLIIKSKIFLKRLDDHYYEYLVRELNLVDFGSSHFETESKRIDDIIECLIPYLLHQGYSTTSISDISYRFISKPKGFKSSKRILDHFKYKKTSYVFLIRTLKGSKEFTFIHDNLKHELIEIKELSIDELRPLINTNNFNVGKDDQFFQLTTDTIDPHNFLRKLYDEGLKLYVSSCDRLELNYFTYFFDNVYWRFGKRAAENIPLFQTSKIKLDPINVPERGSTLRHTLERVLKHYQSNKGIPIFEDLKQSIYFYNLALGSKSIENSLSLLWTSLEILIPYRTKEYDIENAQYFVSKSLSIGSISRELMSFAARMVETDKLHKGELKGIYPKLNKIGYSTKALIEWVQWLSQDFSILTTDPYTSMKSYSNLLCKKFCHLNNIYSGAHKEDNTVNYWLNKIKGSESAIHFQLDRIYLHRNQIVHTGKFINEYSNLWSHLEWYVGKLLAYAIIRKIENDQNLEDIFIGLEADNEQIISLLEINKDKKISEISDLYHLIFKHTWQSF